MNQLILGDNLQILQQYPTDTVDLIYLDPPFFSNRTYEVIWGDKGEIRSFDDRFSGGIDHYIAWLRDRVVQMHRILKPTGSIFLHCDWHANAYIRVQILDRIFGMENFRGEIIWKRHNAHNDAKKKLGVLTDTIWYYSKTEKCTYHPIYVPLDTENNHYKHEDNKGKYFLSDLTAPNIRNGDSGKEWRDYNPSTRNRHWAVPVVPMETLVGEDKAKTLSTQEKLELLYENGLIVISKTGVPSFKRYLSDSKGVIISNHWGDITNLGANAKERIGYPTQKPEKLLARIVEMCSNEGDLILDPFVGGGTTVAVCDKIKRNWVGIDQSVSAIKVTEMRLQKQQDLFSQPFTVRLHKYDYDVLRYKDAFEFETFIVEQFGGVANKKQRGDMGLDGTVRHKTEGAEGTALIQVKRSDAVGRNVVDNFKSACERYDKNNFEKNRNQTQPVGYIIAFSFGKGAIQEVARLKNDENLIIELVEVANIVAIAKKPNLSVAIEDMSKDKKGMHEVKFTATAASKAGIEFYSWDFEHQADTKQFRADVMIDKTGIQQHKFKTGTHFIAVKVVDNEGLDNIEVLKLKINGIAERSTTP